MIPVTKSFLPPIKEYMAQVQRAYDNEWLTNRGELVVELEKKLTNYLQLEESKILITNNGTIPLQIALKLLGNGGEIITTPFSYVATTSAIVWENCTPVYVDINPEYLTIDASKIEDAITEKTTCILATHVFGNPCDIEKIDRIAKKHNLKVIYDAAHCFGVRYKGKSIFEYGDISTCSFHATKLFHTGEGGAVFCKDPDLFHQVYYSHNFGHNGPIAFYGLGVNGKISELNAAMGLAVLPYMDDILKKRKAITAEYIKQFESQPSIKLLQLFRDTHWNHSYFPILFESEDALLKAEDKLKENDILPRRYFYPSLSDLNYVKSQSIEIANDIASRVLCLPIFYELILDDLKKVVQVINRSAC
ncbi:DegT/DnrJ/EryC1/StrS family aminotransferase [Algoriphagus hitonicola]|uniref:dTDP-4-amino-4,6-dideoxygalactose transaminase n=1 Tax=Algoriphagus hitonicola TaxID=435880 RepID=A0A1I2XV03_9BACT|nr:DegT/DnrJ/EryC1/StrS family aminotransferase [Algoriphagus hitonicola]SFH15951.1 dTDP-4-amino-4,6-dideoxygalactose transaminase [Algoriphagus hitonicola]